MMSGVSCCHFGSRSCTHWEGRNSRLGFWWIGLHNGSVETELDPRVLINHANPGLKLLTQNDMPAAWHHVCPLQARRAAAIFLEYIGSSKSFVLRSRTCRFLRHTRRGPTTSLRIWGPSQSFDWPTVLSEEAHQATGRALQRPSGPFLRQGSWITRARSWAPDK